MSRQAAAASWTDPTLVKSGLFTALGTHAEDRLRFYAERFNTVEVDATYYTLPAERDTEPLAERALGIFSSMS